MNEELSLQLEAAPVIVNPDGDGGYIVAVITDEALLAAAQEIADENNWNEIERDGLYEAVVALIDRLKPSTEEKV